ncbi:MAG: FprA family A-type flavoprotein [Defluviitaleaceae bacterium]|nr:FprA family A-type flavoprotein [Defluviitaleaceae bacterium]
MYKSLEVRPNIHWVGALDFDLRIFDIIMYTDYGTTYNSYVVTGSEKTALIEVVKEPFFDEFLERLKSVQGVSNIDYIVLNHTEPDHSGAVAKALEAFPGAKVVGSAMACKFMRNIINAEFDHIVAKDGDTLDLGGLTLEFISAPSLHWPDTMYTYLPEARTLFTCDSFGCHYADEAVFNDKMDGDFTDAYKYYFDCIMGPFKSSVLDALNKIKGLEIETICNGHGPVLRRDIERYIKMYEEWATIAVPDRTSVVVAYVSAYGYTAKMAEKIAEGVRDAGGIDVHVFDLVYADQTDVMRHIESAKGLLIGTPTLVGDTLPQIWNLLTSLNPIIHKGKLAGVFGSYGWSGEGIKSVKQRLDQLRFKQPVDSLGVVFNPSGEQLDQCFEYGKAFGRAVL